jgi:hypothetical protein
MNAAQPPKVPVALQPAFAEITAITGRFCAEHLDPEYSRSDMLDQNPMVWMIQVNDLIVDARWLPEALQVEAWRRGLIPYVPAHTAPGDPTGPSAVRP